jgi:hypothetical protein
MFIQASISPHTTTPKTLTTIASYQAKHQRRALHAHLQAHSIWFGHRYYFSPHAYMSSFRRGFKLSKYKRSTSRSALLGNFLSASEVCASKLQGDSPRFLCTLTPAIQIRTGTHVSQQLPHHHHVLGIHRGQRSSTRAETRGSGRTCSSAPS